MQTSAVSDTLAQSSTHGIRVTATAVYLPAESDPGMPRHVFRYDIVIANDGDTPAQLVSRHWIIIDANGRREEVEGPGVVGATPRLQPGEKFEYQSFCPLKTKWGTMEGAYHMQRDDGQKFDVAINRFYLRTT
jgi:ApaG protein